ncbi:MAG: transcriptional repressor [Desulfurococcales archaeon]|nr:transcriptional repressor [Desulfurococcales archaeon]
MIDRELDEAIYRLTRLGYRITPQRIFITRLILERIESHPSFMDIHEEAKRILPHIGISTTYNTVKMLEEAGIISTFDVDGKTHLDRPHPHVNIICKDTGEIVDLRDSNIIETIEDVLVKHNIKARGSKIFVHTRCKD